MERKMPLFRKTALTFVLSGCLLGGVVPLHADQRSDCERRIHRAEENREKAVRKHGEQCPQAERRRRELEEVRQQCREFYRDHDDHHDHDDRH